MKVQKEIPTQLLDVISELNRNWPSASKAEIVPIFEECEFWDIWYLSVTVKDYKFRFPWDEKITLEEVNNNYGNIFRSTCYAVENAIYHGISIGSNMCKKSIMCNISSSIDKDIKKSIHDFKNT